MSGLEPMGAFPTFASCRPVALFFLSIRAPVLPPPTPRRPLDTPTHPSTPDATLASRIFLAAVLAYLSFVFQVFCPTRGRDFFLKNLVRPVSSTFLPG